MADFAKAIEYVLANEGGYVNNPADPGGETNFGISKRQYPLLNIKDLTRDEAIAIYERDYWNAAPFAAIASQRIATKVFDHYVNMAPSTCVRILQLALGYLHAGPVVADGKMGPETLEHVNAADEQTLLDEFKARLAKFYCDDTLENVNLAGELMGWLRRAVKEPRP